MVWQNAIDLVTEIYRCTQKFPASEIYGLTSQIRRSAVSVPSNVAEGQGRLSRGEFRQFLGHARGSNLELETQLIIARNLNYVSEAEAEKLLATAAEVNRMLNGLLQSISD
jgi:four helix bundle protein